MEYCLSRYLSSVQANVETLDRRVFVLDSGPGFMKQTVGIGLNRSAIGTLVERSSRFAMLVHLPRANGYRLISRTKNGPAL